MKIYIHFKITDKPFGGGNSFLKAFKYYCEQNGIELAKSINDDYDILFANAANKTPLKLTSIDELINVKYYGFSNKYIAKLKKKPKKRKIIVYRSDGFRDNYAQMEGNVGDIVQKQMLHLADNVVFQNQFSFNTANREHIGYCANNYSIIYNGVNQDMFQIKRDFWDGKRKLKIFSSSWSDNPNKGHADIAKISELEGVEVTYCGRWPKSVDPKNVKILSPKTQEELAKEYQKYDIFLLPTKYDSLPNVHIEAISCGLPIIYHETSGIKELANECGLAIDEKNPEKTINEMREKYQQFVDYIKTNKEHFGINRCAAEYIEYFKKILEENR